VKRRAFVGAAAAALIGLPHAAARAGRDCEARAADVDAFGRGMGLAERLAATLDASRAGVVVLARAGQDLRRWGLRWSHLGFAYRDAAAGGAWRVLHKLNTCGSDRAAIWRQGLGQFFLDDPFEYAAAWVEPVDGLQRRLHAMLLQTLPALRMHEPAYSMVAYPWAQRYQQSNQWVLETIATACDPPATDRERAQAALKLRGYAPTVVRVDALTRLGARIGSANVAFDDHPGEKRWAGRIETVGADSVLEWLTRSGLAGERRELR
jgi:hypothetical protein